MKNFENNLHRWVNYDYNMLTNCTLNIYQVIFEISVLMRVTSSILVIQKTLDVSNIKFFNSVP